MATRRRSPQIVNPAPRPCDYFLGIRTGTKLSVCWSAPYKTADEVYRGAQQQFFDTQDIYVIVGLTKVIPLTNFSKHLK